MHSSPFFTPLKSSFLGAVHNVTAWKINCVQAVGLGQVFEGHGGLQRSRPVIFQAGHQANEESWGAGLR